MAADNEILRYIKNEGNGDEIYMVAVACLERLAKTNKPGAIKAIVDAGTASLVKMIKE